MVDRALKALHVAAILMGWALLTLAVARAVRPDIVWPASLGLFCLSFAGWGHLRILAAAGVWAIRRKALDS